MATKAKLATTTCLEGVTPMISGLPSLLASQKLSDFTIITALMNPIPVHRVVLSLHSAVLAKSCNGDFSETQKAAIKLDHEDCACVEAMVHYMYHFDYELPETEIENPSAFHVSMAVIADKYEIAALKDAAIVKCKASLPSTADEADAFADTIGLAYDHVVALPDVCQHLVTYALNHSEIGVGDKIHPALRPVIQSHPDLAMDITEAMHVRLAAKSKAEVKTTTGSNFSYRCNGCGTIKSLGEPANIDSSYWCGACRVRIRGYDWDRVYY